MNAEPRVHDPAYTDEKHDVSLSRMEIDVLAFSLAESLGYVESIAAEEGVMYVPTEDGENTQHDLLQRLLDLSERLR